MAETKNWPQHLGIWIHFELNSQIFGRAFSMPLAYLKIYFPVVAVTVSLGIDWYKFNIK